MKNTLQIPVKFLNGEKLYTIKKIKVNVPCCICEGKGTIEYNEKNMRCPECMGTGSLETKKTTNVVHENPFIITQTKIAINRVGQLDIKYRGYCGFEILNRTEENLFLTREEAQEKCDELNKEIKVINVEDIEIQQVFKDHTPSPDKVINKLTYYKDNGKFAKYIRVDKNNVLQDGYIDYLLCKMFGIETTKVLVV